MKLPTTIYYCCVAGYSAMMAQLGYTYKTWPFWMGLIFVIAAHGCGEARGRYIK